MASFSGPKLSNRIADDVPAIQEILGSLAKLTPDSGNTDYPNGTKRVTETTNGYEFQQYNGTSWVTLEKWNLDAQKVDGYSASTGTTANTIPVRNANGKLPGDILGNAATATKATALSDTNPIATGGTGATTAEQARANLGTPPKAHASTSTEYGAGTSTQYGHLKSHDEPDATLTAATGHAFSPAGAASMKTELEEQIEEVETEASTQLSSLDSTLRALIAQEVAKCLKTSGGTMTGALDFATANGGGYLYNDADIFYIGGRGTDVKDSAFIRFFGLNDVENPGSLQLFTRLQDGNWGPSLFLRRDGAIWWNNNTVLTSAGGTVQGEFLVRNYADFIRREVNNDRLVFLGGPNWEQCAYLELFGGDNTGRVQFNARNSSNASALALYPNGRLELNGMSVIALVASWQSGNNWYRKYSDGWIEQGGYVAKSTTPYAYVGYHLPFANTNYFFTSSATPGSTDASGGDGHQDRSTTGCTIMHTAFYHNGAGAFWYACGY